MTEETIKCVVSRYDDTIKEAPFKTIAIDTIELSYPAKDNAQGTEKYNRLCEACRAKGYVFKFYTMSQEKGITYEVVVK